jgi:hypothetical protein
MTPIESRSYNNSRAAREIFSVLARPKIRFGFLLPPASRRDRRQGDGTPVALSFRHMEVGKMFHHWKKSLVALGLIVAGFNIPSSAWATVETQSALNSLARARSFTASQNWRLAEHQLEQSRHTLSLLRREPRLHDAVRAIDDAQDTLRRVRFDGRGIVISVLRSIQEAEHAILTSDAHRFGGGHRPSRGRVECRAVDRGWEEHRGGHVAEGFNEFLVRQRALGECQRFHARCQVSCRAAR